MTCPLPCGPGLLSATFGHHFFASVRPWSALSNFWPSLFLFYAALVGSQQLLGITFSLPCSLGWLSATFGHYFFASVRPWSALSNFWASLFRFRAALVGSQQLLAITFSVPCGPGGSQQLWPLLVLLPCGLGWLSATFGHHFSSSMRPWSALSNFWPSLFRFRAALVGSQQLLVALAASQRPLRGPGRLPATLVF
jgi:hypothetical protein